MDTEGFQSSVRTAEQQVLNIPVQNCLQSLTSKRPLGTPQGEISRGGYMRNLHPAQRWERSAAPPGDV